MGRFPVFSVFFVVFVLSLGFLGAFSGVFSHLFVVSRCFGGGGVLSTFFVCLFFIFFCRWCMLALSFG